jgi:hypothetical protein
MHLDASSPIVLVGVPIVTTIVGTVVGVLTGEWVKGTLRKIGGRTFGTGASNVLDDESGVIKLCDRLPTGELEKEISRATDDVEILQTWADNIDVLRGSLELAAKRDVRVRILFLDPKSVMLSYRVRECDGGKVSAEHLRAKIEVQINNLKAWRAAWGPDSKIEVRKYDGTPVITIYRADKIVYIGNFWRAGSAMNCPQIKAKSGGFYERWARKHFNAIWDDPVHTTVA